MSTTYQRGIKLLWRPQRLESTIIYFEKVLKRLRICGLKSCNSAFILRYTLHFGKFDINQVSLANVSLLVNFDSFFSTFCGNVQRIGAPCKSYIYVWVNIKINMQPKEQINRVWSSENPLTQKKLAASVFGWLSRIKMAEWVPQEFYQFCRNPT